MPFTIIPSFYCMSYSIKLIFTALFKCDIHYICHWQFCNHLIVWFIAINTFTAVNINALVVIDTYTNISPITKQIYTCNYTCNLDVIFVTIFNFTARVNVLKSCLQLYLIVILNWPTTLVGKEGGSWRQKTMGSSSLYCLLFQNLNSFNVCSTSFRYQLS